MAFELARVGVAAARPHGAGVSRWRLVKHTQNGVEVLVLLIFVGARLVLHVDELGYDLVAVEAVLVLSPSVRVWWMVRYVRVGRARPLLVHAIFWTQHELDAVLDRLDGDVDGLLRAADQVLAHCADVLHHAVANVFACAALAGHGVDLVECFQDDVLG